MKENKKLYLIIGGIIGGIAVLLVLLLVILFILKIAKDNDIYGNNKAVTIKGVYCGEDCREYNNLEMDTKYTLKYVDDLKINVDVFSAYEYENSNITISVNGKEIYNISDFTTNVKIFEFDDVYVVEYVKSQSQCGNKVDILIRENGTLLGIPGSEFNDTFNYSADDVVTPTIMKTEFNDNNDTVIVYKEMCAMCSDNIQQIGFKYTYLLEDSKLIFKNKENIYCTN